MTRPIPQTLKIAIETARACTISTLEASQLEQWLGATLADDSALEARARKLENEVKVERAARNRLAKIAREDLAKLKAAADRALGEIVRARIDAEAEGRDGLEGARTLRSWLRCVHARAVGLDLQCMNQGEIAEALGEYPRGHAREFMLRREPVVVTTFDDEPPPGHTPVAVTSDGEGTLCIAAAGFTVIRACMTCGVLMIGGPTRCRSCVRMGEW